MNKKLYLIAYLIIGIIVGFITRDTTENFGYEIFTAIFQGLLWPLALVAKLFGWL